MLAAVGLLVSVRQGDAWRRATAGGAVEGRGRRGGGAERHGEGGGAKALMQLKNDEVDEADAFANHQEMTRPTCLLVITQVSKQVLEESSLPF
jgi:hypothetical protein